MTRFAQIHLLTAYPPSNLNRDDLGRPKSVEMGGRNRLRISSQCLKRTWRTSDIFATALENQVGTRTKSLGQELLPILTRAGVDADEGTKRLEPILSKFGKLKKGKLDTEQLVHFTPSELFTIRSLVERLASENRAPSENELALLTRDDMAADVAMFGRMLAASPELNVDAAVQVAHAVTVHEARGETDFFTAVDDLASDRDETGSGHMGELEFGNGIFYLYICVDLQQLTKNLEGKPEVARQALKALAKAAATTSPSGKQNSFASRARASWVRAELGDQQPRTLAAAFFEPVPLGTNDPMLAAIERIEAFADRMDGCYGACVDETRVLNVPAGAGRLDEIEAFLADGVPS